MQNPERNRIVREGSQGKFEASMLRGSDYSGADLTGSSFKGSDAREANFDGTNLTDCTLMDVKRAISDRGS